MSGLSGESFEDNCKNPSIARVAKITCPHYFLIKYQTEDERITFAKMVMNLVKKYELKDFHLEEKKAFVETKVFYNYHTLEKGKVTSPESFEENFLKFFKP